MTRRLTIVASVAVIAAVGALSCIPEKTHTATDGPFTITYKLKEKRRIDRTRFRYTYTAFIQNAGDDVPGVSAIVSSSDSSTLVIDDNLTFSALGSGASSPSLDTFELEQDRAHAFDPSDLTWEIAGWSLHSDPDVSFETPVPAGFTPQAPLGPGPEIVYLSDINGTTMYIMLVEASTSYASIADWADSRTWPFPSDWRDHLEEITVNSSPGLRDPVTGGVVTLMGSSIIRIENGIGREDRVQIAPEIFESVLRSFEGAQ